MHYSKVKVKSVTYTARDQETEKQKNGPYGWIELLYFRDQQLCVFYSFLRPAIKTFHHSSFSVFFFAGKFCDALSGRVNLRPLHSLGMFASRGNRLVDSSPPLKIGHIPIPGIGLELACN